MKTLLLSILAAVTFAAPARAATPCTEYSSLRKLQKESPAETGSIAEWATYKQKLWQEWKSTTRKIFRTYHSGLLTAHHLDVCFPSKDDRKSLDELLPQVFLEETLVALGKSKSASVQRFLGALKARTNGSNVLLFRLLGHFREEPPPTDSLGGAQRGSGSIFLNFSRIDPNEWLIIFIHEVLHFIDHRLMTAVEKFSDPALVSEIAKLGKTIQDPDQLDPALRLRLDTWLTAGLDRGFLAEYRAWVVTFKIYQEGLKEGLWRPIPWLDTILNGSSHKNLKKTIFAYLDPRFTDPVEGIFSVPLVSRELAIVRRGLRDSNPPDLANLEGL